MNLCQAAPKLHGFGSGGPAYPGRGFCSAHGGGQPAGIDAVGKVDHDALGVHAERGGHELACTRSPLTNQPAFRSRSKQT